MLDERSVQTGFNAIQHFQEQIKKCLNDVERKFKPI